MLPETFHWSPGSPNRLNRRAIPNIAVTDQDGSKLNFYQDLVQDKTVLIAFTSIEHNQHYPCLPKLAEIRQELDQGPAAMTTILTLTLEPEKDTPRRWAQMARQMGAGNGWRFLHAGPDEVETLRAALYINRGNPDELNQHKMWSRADFLRLSPEKAVMHCSLGLMRYGLEKHDLWGGVPVRASARDIAGRLETLCGGLCSAPGRTRRRAGPSTIIKT